MNEEKEENEGTKKDIMTTMITKKINNKKKEEKRKKKKTGMEKRTQFFFSLINVTFVPEGDNAVIYFLCFSSLEKVKERKWILKIFCYSIIQYSSTLLFGRRHDFFNISGRGNHYSEASYKRWQDSLMSWEIKFFWKFTHLSRFWKAFN